MGREAVLNVNLRPRVGLDTQILLWAGMEIGEAAYMAVMINFRGEQITKALEETEEHNRLRAQSGWRNQRVHRLTSPPTHTWRLSKIFSHVDLHDPLTTGVGLQLI